MNSKERLHNAVAGQPLDMPAVAPAYLSLYLDARAQQFYRAAYEQKMAGRTRLQIDSVEDARYRAEAILRAYEVLGEQPDWIHTHLAETRTWAERGEMRFVEGRWLYVDRHSGETVDMDEPGRLMLSTATRYSYPARTANADLWDESAGLDGPSDVDALVPVRSAGELAAQGAFDVTANLAKLVGDRLPLSCIAPTPFWSTYGLLGFQGMMVMMREKPDLFTYLMQRRGRQRMEVLAGHAAAGVQYLWLEECLSSADLISPRDYERFAFATAGPYIAEAKRLGLTVVLYYCGDVMSRLPWLKRLGMDALAVEESKKGFSVDIADVIAGAGDTCCVFGNVDAIEVMFEGTRETIQAEVFRQLRLGRQAKGFVLCQGSPFTLDTPPDKVGWFVSCGRRIEPETSRGDDLFHLRPSIPNQSPISTL
jgi:uroporphyrinogen-III decarboxylase